MIEPGTLLQDRYLIEKQIGEGGMGAVYLAEDRRFGSRVALKETFFRDEDLRLAFEREARLLNGLRHPVLPHVSDYFTEDGGYFLVMEFIEGDDLSAILKRDGAFEVEVVLKWADDLLDALEYLHSQEPPVIHRDIKPQNLKLTTRGDIVLLDFGLAKQRLTEDSAFKSVLGYSRTYSPLEQIQGTGTNARSDIFALGATVVHLLTGKPPVDVLTRAAVIIAGKPDPLTAANVLNPKVSPAVAAVLDKALAINAENRFAAAGEMREALRSARDPLQNVEVQELIDEANDVHSLGDGTVTMDAALSSFAAEIQSPSASAEEVVIPGDALITSADGLPPAQFSVKSTNPSPQITEVVRPNTAPIRDEATRVARRPSKKWLTVAASVAVLLIGGLAALFIVNRAASTAESKQVPVAQPTSAPLTEAETVAPVSTVEKTKVSRPTRTVPIIEKTDQTEEPTVAPKRAATALRETPAPSTPPTKPTATARATPPQPPAVAEARQPIAQKQPAPSKPARLSSPPVRRSSNSSSRPPTRDAASSPPASSIERVMSGETSAAQEERRLRREERRLRRERRREREQLSDTEEEELRRRRTADILRQNRQPIP